MHVLRALDYHIKPRPTKLEVYCVYTATSLFADCNTQSLSPPNRPNLEWISMSSRAVHAPAAGPAWICLYVVACFLQALAHAASCFV